MPPLETRVTAQITRKLRGRGAYVVKIHGSPYQPATIDLFVCYRGRFIGIEDKRDQAHKPTHRQQQVLGEISSAGGTALVAWSWAQVEPALDRIDRELDG